MSYLEVLCRTSEILGQVVNCSIQVSKTRTIHKSNNLSNDQQVHDKSSRSAFVLETHKTARLVDLVFHKSFGV